MKDIQGLTGTFVVFIAETSNVYVESLIPLSVHPLTLTIPNRWHLVLLVDIKYTNITEGGIDDIYIPSRSIVYEK